MRSTAHLIERAAERLLREGGVPGYRSADQSAVEPAPGARDLGGATVRPPIDITRLLAAGLIAESAARSRVGEELWLVQRQILRLAFAGGEAESATPNLLMISSSRPDEGKSFTAVNLAASVARQGDHPVLLVDTDVKQHSLTDRMGQGDMPGLLDLVDEPSLDPVRATLPTAIGNLHFLPIGRSRPQGSDVLSARHTTRLLQGLAKRSRDRLVILDTPPCLATSDAAAIAPVVGQILLIVEAERTQRQEVESALDLLQECRTITLLLNKVQHSGVSQGFGAYSPYYTA